MHYLLIISGFTQYVGGCHSVVMISAIMLNTSLGWQNAIHTLKFIVIASHSGKHLEATSWNIMLLLCGCSQKR